MAEHYRPIVDDLSSAGHQVTVCDMPSCDSPKPLRGMSQDVAVIQKAIQSYIDQNRNVALIMHSLGGVIGTAACEGYLPKDQSNGKGVVSLIYLAAFVATVGGSCWSAKGGAHAPWIDTTGEPGTGVYMFPRNDETWDPREVFYNACSAEQKEAAWAMCKRNHSEDVYHATVDYAAWREVESNYLLCEVDIAIPVEYQEAMSSHEGGKWKNVERVKADHAPFLSRPAETLAFVRRCVGQGV